MSEKINHSPFEIAAKFVNGTHRDIFLTGKAGTGKTTFLKTIVEQTHKKVMVAAPTGIAAINAGGVTLHSLFHLPFGIFLPEGLPPREGFIASEINTPRSIRKSLRMNSHKRQLIREMELLIIDEVSMLRADTLDAIDHVLRLIRRKKQIPFGGVQMVFIGDLLQLPPVVKKEERRYLETYYPTGYFFEARVLQNRTPLYIELEKIFRQSDPDFIRILNHFRDNQVTRHDLEKLNSHYAPSFKPQSQKGYIFLTTHNHKADEINRDALRKLPGRSFHFYAEVDGDFSEHLYPVDYDLELKEGAQVMFIKNDYSGEQRYFNGKIGTVSELSDEEIEVSFTDGSSPATVEYYTWENKQYSLDKNTNEIREKVKGTFTHLPVKLAWAITVHKSQGLTFGKAIIDVSRAFAPGQIYVALSRLVSLDGLVLNAPLPNHMLEPDPALRAFTTQKQPVEKLEQEYSSELPRFLYDYVAEAFDLRPVDEELNQFISSFNKDEKHSARQQFKLWATELRKDFKEARQVADRFQIQLQRLRHQKDPQWLSNLEGRVKAAAAYFRPILENFSQRINQHAEEMKSEAGVKKYMRELEDLDRVFFSRLQSIEKSRALVKAVTENRDITRDNVRPGTLCRQEREQRNNADSKKNFPGKEKKKKTGTKDITLHMFREGKSAEDIASERSLAVSTIEGHLSHWVSLGEIPVTHFIDPKKLDQILEVARRIESLKLNDIKARLGDEFTYSDLRFAMAHYRYIQEKKKPKA
jgi:hypothetical protein